MARQKRWIKFKGKAPRYCDPAENFFEVKVTFKKTPFTACYWATDMVLNEPTFHTNFGTPIDVQFITHYRYE